MTILSQRGTGAMPSRTMPVAAWLREARCSSAWIINFIISRNEHAFSKSPIKRLSARDYVDLFCEVDEINL